MSLLLLTKKKLQLSWGKLRRKPAIRWFDESFAPIPTSDKWFAHQYRYRPPSEFPLTSSCAGIVHHHSGSYTSAQAPWKIQSLSLRLYFFRAKTRTTVKLPNPCFKTGAYKMPYPRQVQALCTLCLRILFIVRSHYFYAIGLLMIFSFRWGIPPKLRQHSQATRLDLDTQYLITITRL